MSYTICYVWQDLDAPQSEQKFGDHYSEELSLEAALKETRAYVRGSLGRQKHKFNEGRVVLHKMWDVTEYAKAKGRFGKHKKVDDLIRPVIGGHVAADVHRVEIEDLIISVNRELTKMHQPLPVVALSAWQVQAAHDVLDMIRDGKRIIAAELAARFGKTIWSGAMIRETNAKLTIVSSYVLTSIRSFEVDLSSYEQFKDIMQINLSTDNWEAELDAAMSTDKQVVAYLSLCNGSLRGKRIEKLCSYDVTRLLFVDEADFGAHQISQAKALRDSIAPNDVVILMTGTNADKASTFWAIDDMVSVTYPELIMEKRAPRSNLPKLQYFEHSTERNHLVVDVQFYQVNLGDVVAKALTEDPEQFADGTDQLPSWTKFAANPTKAKGFWTRMLQAVFLGQHNHYEANIDFQMERRASKEGPRVAMMFLSGSIRNENLAEAAAIAQEALPGYDIVKIYGDECSNKTAQDLTKERIKQAQKLGRSVLVISAGMGSRSYSVADITEVYLAYDSGDQGATIQKMSRALTPGIEAKTGRIISLSFDPNRDDKFDSIILETAVNYQKSTGMDSTRRALDAVLKTIDIFSCTNSGAVQMTIDQYHAEALARRSISRVIGKTSNIQHLTVAQLEALVQGSAKAFTAAKQAASEMGKKSAKSMIPAEKGKIERTSATAKLLAKARDVITGIIENLDILTLGTGAKDLKKAMAIVSGDMDLKRQVIESFGVEIELIEELFSQGVINESILQLQLDKS